MVFEVVEVAEVEVEVEVVDTGETPFEHSKASTKVGLVAVTLFQLVQLPDTTNGRLVVAVTKAHGSQGTVVVMVVVFGHMVKVG